MMLKMFSALLTGRYECPRSPKLGASSTIEQQLWSRDLSIPLREPLLKPGIYFHASSVRGPSEWIEGSVML